MQTEKIKFCCAKCGFTVEEFTAAELAEFPQKAERHRYLLQEASLCPSCLASGRLKEVHVTAEASAWPKHLFNQSRTNPCHHWEPEKVRPKNGRVEPSNSKI
jgi:hypothetical protein